MTETYRKMNVMTYPFLAGLHNRWTEIIFRHGGFIWGGYVRDAIAGDSPHDIDVAVSNERVQEFYSELSNLGYHEGNCHTLEPSDDLRDQGAIPIDVIENDDENHVDHLIKMSFVDFASLVDFDVNCLGYDGITLFLWTGSTMSPQRIIQSIQTRTATKMNPRPHRIEKMIAKGYQIKESPP